MRWFLLMLLLAGCASATLTPEPSASPSQVSIRALLTAPATYDRQPVLVQGQIEHVLRGQTMEGGRRVTIFTLVGADGQRIRAVMWGFPSLLEGSPVELRGIFRAGFRIDERDFQGIIEIREIRPLL